MKTLKRYILLPCLITCFIAGCARTEDPEDPETNLPITLSVNHEISTRALDDPTSTVNRILVLPFQKINTSLSDNDLTNFIPAYGFAKQWDIATFPSGNLTLKLPTKFTYTVLVIGYNANDYDFNNHGAVENRFSIGSVASPTNLGNFHLYPKAPNVVPEFFSCFLSASNNGTPLGTTFTPTNTTNISLGGQLNRLVSGLTVTITGIPTFVESISLTAERMVKAIQVSDTTASLVQTPGDNQSRLIQQLVPSGGQVLFSNLLLPTQDANKTKLYLNVSYGQTTETYMIKVPDMSSVSSGNSITLNPNHVVNILGTYAQINFGFTLTYAINLDDNKWDGLQ